MNRRTFTIEEKRKALEDLHKEVKEEIKNGKYDANRHTAKAIGIIFAGKE